MSKSVPNSKKCIHNCQLKSVDDHVLLILFSIFPGALTSSVFVFEGKGSENKKRIKYHAEFVSLKENLYMQHALYFLKRQFLCILFDRADSSKLIMDLIKFTYNITIFFITFITNEKNDFFMLANTMHFFRNSNDEFFRKKFRMIKRFVSFQSIEKKMNMNQVSFY